jgi:outer membrane protein TolC
LNDAILLAMRENPNVQRQQLSHVSEKYALELAEWKFKPHYFLDATKTTSQQYSTTASGLVTQNTTAINPKVTLKTVYGTDITLNATNNIGNNYNPTVGITVIQPLLKGFGRPIVEAELLNAMDSEKISRLNLEDRLRSTVTNVINAYLDVISAEKTLEIDKNALKRAEKSVEQTKLFIKAGHKAGVELVTVQASVAESDSKIEADKNNLAQARMRLLQEIGLDPDTNIVFSDIDIPTLIKKYSIPVLADAKKLVVEHDVSYQAAQMTYEGATKRSLVIAEDNTRWKLDVTANAATGSSGGGGPNAGINSLVNGMNRTDNVRLDLSIPIDDQAAKIGLANAKIALRQAAIGLKEQKWEEETKAINAWNAIFSAERSLKLSEQAEVLQQKMYNIYEQKYNYGLIDSLELQSTRQQYMTSQQQFVAQQINYLKALVSLDQLIGRTLETWHIQVNYD